MLVTQSCQLCAIPWTVAHQAPLTMEFSRQEYWSRLPFPSPGDLPDPGIKPGTKLDNTLKSRDITLPTKFHLVKALFFPVVMYGCESWIIKKVECQRIDALNCGVGD